MIDTTMYRQLLGAELRAARTARNVTFPQLVDLIGGGLTCQALKNYEYGTHGCAVDRLATLCEALDVEPEELIRRVSRQLGRSGELLCVSLVKIVMFAPEHLGPLRRWARVRLTVSSPAQSYVDLTPEAVERMAMLCEVTVPYLREQMRKWRPTRVKR